MRWRTARGQTVTEVLMVVGLLTAITIGVLGFTHRPFQRAMRNTAECVLGDVCEGNGSGGGIGGGGGGFGGGGGGGPFVPLPFRPPGAGGGGGIPGIPIGPIGPMPLPRIPCERERLEHVRQLAYFADDVYNDVSLEPTGRRVAGPGVTLPKGLDGAVFKDDTSGFQAALYEVTPGSGQYVLAFAGTDFKDVKGDLKTDIYQSLGIETAQYEQAARLTQQVKDWVGQRGGTLELTGHSLGGGLASTGAMNSGVPATTFNMARPSDRTIEKYGIVSDWESNLDNYQVEGEFLSPLQNLKGMRKVGTEHTLPSTSWDPVSRHLMKDVKSGLDKRIANAASC